MNKDMKKAESLLKLAGSKKVKEITENTVSFLEKKDKNARKNKNRLFH